MILRPRWLCTRLQFVRGQNTNIIYHMYLCIKHRILYLLFYFLFARRFGFPGNIVTCNDGNTYIVVHNDFQSTIILYRENIFTILLCCTKLKLPRMFTYDISNKIQNSGFHQRYVKTIHGECDIIYFRNILESFNKAISYLESLEDTFYIDCIAHVRILHTHLLYLTERPVLLIQRMFRKSISNPEHKMCERRLLREYHNFINDIEHNIKIKK